MGMIQSKNNSETLDWDKINTDSFSSNLPTLKAISRDTKELLDKLNLTEEINYEETESENSNIFTWLNSSNPQDIKELNKISSLINSKNGKDNNVSNIEDNNEDYNSETSPFISDEQLENLINEKTSESESHKKNQQGGGVVDTSSTSIGSVSRLSRRDTINSDSDLSYISSSAHTNQHNTEVDTELIDEKSELDSSKSTEMISIQDSYVDTETLNIDSLKSTETQDYSEKPNKVVDSEVAPYDKSEISESSVEATTISVENQNLVSSEINTSDINMLSSDK